MAVKKPTKNKADVPDRREVITDENMTRGERMRLRWSPSFRYVLWVACAALVTMTVLLIAYLGVLLVAVELVPAMMIILTGHLGVPLESLALETVIVYWMAPGLLMVMVLAGLVLLGIRALWAWRSHVVRRMKTWFLGADDGEPGEAPEPLGRAVRVPADQKRAGGARSRSKAVRSDKDTNSLKNEEKV